MNAGDPERPAAASAQANGSNAQESKGDSSSDNKIVKIWSEKANEWHYAFAKYIHQQAKKGRAEPGKERAWTSLESYGWFVHEEGFEVELTERDNASWSQVGSSANSRRKKVLQVQRTFRIRI